MIWFGAYFFQRAARDTNSDEAVTTRPGILGLLSKESVESVTSHRSGERFGDVGF